MAATSRPSHARTFLGFCVSCCATLLCWALWIVLGISLVSLAYVALARELAVPDFVLRRVETKLADAGFALRFGHARFDPTGRIVLENVQLRTRRFSDPILTCRLLYVRRDFWSLLAGQTNPDEIRIEGASLQLPAMLSPSGTTEPVVRNLAATFRYERKAWQIDQFAGRVGALALTLRGELPVPPTRLGTPAAEFSLETVAGHFLKTARSVMPHLQRLDAFTEPALAVQLGRTRADAVFTAAAVRQPWGRPVSTGPLVATFTLPLPAPSRQEAEIFFSVGRIDGPHGVRAESVRGILRVQLDGTATIAVRPLGVDLAAARVQAAGESFYAPLLAIDLSAWPRVSGATQTHLAGEFLAVEVDAALREKTARVHAAGRVAPTLIARLLTQHTPRAAAYFVFGDPVAFDAVATLGPDWRFATLRSRVDARRLDSRGVNVTAARGRIDIDGTNFLAHDARVAIGQSHARGSYWMDFATTDYRMLLDGQLQPVDIAGWFRGDWWTAFWTRYFDFPGELPRADVDIQGRWKDPLQSNNFVRAKAGPVKVWGGDFEQVNATVFVRPGFSHGWNLEGRRAGGTERVSGWFKRFGPAAADAGRFEFDFAGSVDPAVVGRMLEGRADAVLATLRFTGTPKIHAWGAVGSRSDFRFTGDSRGPLHYYGFPLGWARASGSVAGPDVEINRVEFAAAGGEGRGRASLTGQGDSQRLGFEMYVTGANLSRAIHAYEEFDATRKGKPYVATPDSKFVRKAANSQLEVAFSASGKPDDLGTFKGSGNASLTGAELGEVHLFGLLSQALTGLSLSFSSLKLDAARTSFDVDKGVAFFPDLKVTGPSAVIDARGKYTLATNTLDFNARFRPYDQPGSLLAAAMSLVLNPLTSMLELKLSGPLGDPKWSVDVTTPGSSPRTPAAPAASSLPPAPAPAPATPPAAAPAPAPAG